MADEEIENEELQEGEEGEKKAKSKLPLIIGGVVGLLILLGAGAYFMGLFGGGNEEEHVEAEVVVVEAPIFVDFPEILVNLNEPGRKGKFLKLKLNFEVTNEEEALAIENLEPRIVDQFQMYLRELRLEDLQGSEGIQRLREELLRRVNDELAPIKVKDVLFKDVLVQ